MIRKAFIGDMNRRFAWLRKQVRKFLVEDDALGLSNKANHLTLHAARQFAFVTDDAKLTAFSDWLDQQMKAGVVSSTTGEPWPGKYIESAYKMGQLNAYISARQGLGSDDPAFIDQSQADFLRQAFAAPERVSKVKLLGTRAFEQLKGVTSTMGSEMNRILAQGMIDGRGADAIAKEMTDRISSLSRSRALTIARTETIHAHAEGQLDSFEDLGVKELNLKAEWSTAGDERVCPICAQLEGKIFEVKEVRGMIPKHPNCRCSWLPAFGKKTEKEKKAAKAEALNPTFPTPLPPVEPRGLKETLSDLLAGKDNPEISKLTKELADYSQQTDPFGKSLAELTRGLIEEKLRDPFHGALKAARPGERFEGTLFGKPAQPLFNPSPLQPRAITRLEKADEFIKDTVHPERLKEAGKAEVRIHDTEIRAHYVPEFEKIVLDVHDTTGTMVHEYGHHLQNKDLNGIMESEKTFLRKRAGLDSKLKVINGLENEVGFKDDFAAKGGSDYTGKVYGDFKNANGDYDWKYGEVLTIGMQRLYDNPAAFFRDDPEFFHWIVDNIQKAP